jgi:hypothetical protein
MPLVLREKLQQLLVLLSLVLIHVFVHLAVQILYQLQEVVVAQVNFL